MDEAPPGTREDYRVLLETLMTFLHSLNHR